MVMPYAATDNSRSVHLLLVVWPVVGIWCSALAVVSFAFNLNGFNFNHSLLDGQGRPIASWADLLNRADLGIEAMHVRHDPNVPLDLSIPAAVSVAWEPPSSPPVPGRSAPA